MITPEEAERLVAEAMSPWPSETCPLAEAHGRVLRERIRADRDIPPFDRVTLDGYALRAAALADGVRTFRVEAEQAAGFRPAILGPAPNACVEIMTGAVLPAGADCVVPYEGCEREGDTVRIDAPADYPAGHAVHPRASDHAAGETIVPAGVRLTGREIAVAASCGCASLTVARRPTVAIVATGDELVEVADPAAGHQIRRSNEYALRAALAAAGYSHTERFFARDTPEDVERLTGHLIAEHDVVILTGGISRGKFDYVAAELEKQGVRKVVQGVAQRPGKPFWFGLSRWHTPVFALPGNPVSSYTCLHRYVLPAMDLASGLAAGRRPMAALSEPFQFRRRSACLLPVSISSGPRAELLATPAPVNTSGDFSGLVKSDGFVELPAGVDDFPAGYCAPFYRWY